MLGEPKRLSLGDRTFTRENLPDHFVAEYSDVAVSIRAGVVQEIRIMTPEYRY
ncbi:MAG TPA: hypothetical protein VN442_12905 [Bryobacteraceae bacterium]|nr:hypothetical protein [Bryobacteraceae bacterium]